MFVSARRDVGAAESTVAVYRDQIWVYFNLPLNIGVDLTNKTAVAYVLTSAADGNNVVGCSHATAGSSA